MGAGRKDDGSRDSHAPDRGCVAQRHVFMMWSIPTEGYANWGFGLNRPDGMARDVCTCSLFRTHMVIRCLWSRTFGCVISRGNRENAHVGSINLSQPKRGKPERESCFHVKYPGQRDISTHNRKDTRSCQPTRGADSFRYRAQCVWLMCPPRTCHRPPAVTRTSLRHVSVVIRRRPVSGSSSLRRGR